MAHDARLAVFDDAKLVLAAHSERYSRIKNDKNLNQAIIDEALEFGEPDKIYFYEQPWLKKTQRFIRTHTTKERITYYIYTQISKRCA